MAETTISLEDADSGTGGRARLRFAGVATPTGPPGQIGLKIRRSDPAQPWLGPQGWQVSEHILDADAVFVEGGDLVLEVGPSIVDAIPAHLVVKVELPSPGLSGIVSWEGVTPSYQPPTRPPGPPPIVVRPTPPVSPAPPVRPAPAVTRPPPAKPPTAARRFAFEAMPERCIAFLPIGSAQGMAPKDLLSGGTIGGLGFAELAQVFKGEIEMAPDGRARITVRSPEGPPALIDFRAMPDGDISLHRADGKRGEPDLLATRARDGGPIFGIPRAQLRGPGRGRLRLEATTLTAHHVRGTRPIALGLVALLFLLLVAGGYAFFPREPDPAVEPPAETTHEQPPSAEPMPPDPAGQEARPHPVESRTPPADPLPDELDAPEPEIGQADPLRDAGPVLPPVQTEPPPPIEPRSPVQPEPVPPPAAPESPPVRPAPTPEPQGEPPAIELPVTEPPPVEPRPPVQPEPVPPPVAPESPPVRPAPTPEPESELPVTEPPATKPPRTAPDALLEDRLPAGRGSGHKLLARMAETASREGCADRQLPFFRVVDSNVDPVRLPAGGTFSHRVVYAYCPAEPGVRVTARITRELRAGDKVLLATEASSFALRPGTWANDEEFMVPLDTVPGNYRVDTRVIFGDREWPTQTDLVVE